MGMLLTFIAGMIVGFIVRSLMEPKKRKAKVLALKDEPIKLTYQPLQEMRVKPPRARRTADQNAIEAEKARQKDNGHDKDPLPS